MRCHHQQHSHSLLNWPHGPHVHPHHLMAAAAGACRQHSTATARATAAAAARSTPPLTAARDAGAAKPVTAAAAAAAAAVDQRVNAAVDTAAAAPPRAAYVHLPFCKRKCFYCDFPVEAVGVNNMGSQRTQDRMAAYVDLVCAEIRATTRLGRQPLETVSFGGGTPSLVPPALLSRLLETLEAQFGLAAGAELSLEADPGTFDGPRLAEYRRLGITRLSMGVQAFQQGMLEACGRSHSLVDVHAAIAAVQQAGIPSWSLDLISGLPHLTPEMWRDSLEQAVAAGPDHISIYDLQVEQGTPFARWYGAGGPGSPLPAEPEAAAMFEAASTTLTAAGYEHYEISNYARPGHRSRHNQVYWDCQPYYAFGLGAASFARGRRFTRPRAMTEYATWVAGYVGGGAGCPAAALPPESQEDQLLDLLMLRLRLSDGLDLQQLQHTFGAPVVATLLPVIAEHMQHGLMQVVGVQQQQQQPYGEAGGGVEACVAQLRSALAEEGRPCGVRLTDPAGFLLSNDVIAGLFAALSPDLLQPPGTLSK